MSKTSYLSSSLMKIYLTNRGHTQTELNHLNDSELFELYKEESLEYLHLFQLELDEQIGNTIKNRPKNYNSPSKLKTKIEKIGKNISKVYDMIDEYIDDYTYEEFLEIFRSYLRIPAVKIQKILKVKYRQLQEVWLEKLKVRFSSLPDEERIQLMDYYEKNRDNIQKLKQIYHLSEDENYIKNIQQISEFKLDIMESFMPELMEENYKAYYDETPEKINLVQEVLTLTHSYPRSFLKELSMSKLVFLKNEIIEQDKREIADKKLFNKHTKALEEALNSPNDTDFSRAALDAITELDSDILHRVVNYLTNKNKAFLNKFNTAIKGYQNILKTKFI
ncbi:hypothetical protein [Helicobacter cappadocius]|uniref:Uncharacterized protein n=1 Tax=Helicobacter cappadocius TaxID=3063998 RepID=A0AA90TFH4_9HELI|nr:MULTISPECIES: hypothetical protein [unclassified Helicobacter]MDO7253667.1 hypothetical protein [Helicobacter sp. faydin-H75]MDP2539645.1 hypothetical protein [Helicobacter sp. faydin-H76]